MVEVLRVVGDGCGRDGQRRDRWVGIDPWLFLMEADHAIASHMPLCQGRRRNMGTYCCIVPLVGPVSNT